MSFPRYPKYKPSGIEWLGTVPEHWQVLPCRAFVDEQTAKNDGGAIQSYLSLMANVGVIPYEEKGDVGNKKPEDLTKCKLVSKGDFVINSMNYGIGSYGLSGLDGVCSPVYIVLRPRLDQVESRYASRIFENREFQGHAQSFGNGILEHRAAIGWDTLKGIHVGIPSKEEQREILAFLDRETAKIDTLVAEQEKLIALLKEKRQALISHAVTKGLDPNMPMKDSGIEWLGQVPAHWSVARLRFLAANMKAGPFGSALTKDMYVTAGYRIYGQEQVIPGDFSVGDYYITSEKFDELRQYEVLPRDILISCVGTFGKIAIVPDSVEPGIINPRLIRLRPSANMNAEFLCEVLRSAVTFEQMSLHSRGGTMDVINIGILGEMLVAVPTAKEQKEILIHITAAKARCYSLTFQAERAIDLLKERRSALISAAVTGKIDVRGLTEAAA